MEIDEKKLREILSEEISSLDIRLSKKIEDEAEASRRYAGVLSEVYDAKLTAVVEAMQPMAQMQKDIAALKESDIKMNDKLDALTSLAVETRDRVDRMEPMLEATFEEVGKLREDMTEVKEGVASHELRLQKVEAR